jgi:hypothetical protein
MVAVDVAAASMSGKHRAQTRAAISPSGSTVDRRRSHRLLVATKQQNGGPATAFVATSERILELS